LAVALAAKQEAFSMAKNIVVLGGGTAGTIISNNLRRHLPDEWTITVIDRDDRHIYQPGLLFVPFGLQKSKTLVKPRQKYFLPGVTFVMDEITSIDPEKKSVKTKMTPGKSAKKKLKLMLAARLVTAPS